MPAAGSTGVACSYPSRPYCVTHRYPNIYLPVYRGWERVSSHISVGVFWGPSETSAWVSKLVHASISAVHLNVPFLGVARIRTVGQETRSSCDTSCGRFSDAYCDNCGPHYFLANTCDGVSGFFRSVTGLFIMAAQHLTETVVVYKTYFILPFCFIDAITFLDLDRSSWRFV